MASVPASIPRSAPTAFLEPVELTMSEIRELPYSPTLEDLERVGIHVDDWIYNSHWPEEWRLRTAVNGGIPTDREATAYRWRIVAMCHRQFLGCCPGCGRKTWRREMVLDHDHRTGKIRGALCKPCNARDELARPLVRRRLEELRGLGLRVTIFEPPATTSWILPPCCRCGKEFHLGTECQGDGL